jgi:hypothetical protein
VSVRYYVKFSMLGDGVALAVCRCTVLELAGYGWDDAVVLVSGRMYRVPMWQIFNGTNHDDVRPYDGSLPQILVMP